MLFRSGKACLCIASDSSDGRKGRRLDRGSSLSFIVAQGMDTVGAEVARQRSSMPPSPTHADGRSALWPVAMASGRDMCFPSRLRDDVTLSKSSDHPNKV